uniref:DUF6087 family protein n=1 Tax=Streptomyces polyasparticus TaxID=2767826 RepID=UPI00280ABC68|nr:DUF6087 family protein [Streptomyces polyasparticus]
MDPWESTAAPAPRTSRHRPAHGGAGHLRPDEPRVLEEWTGFTYEVTGTADNLAAAQQWMSGIQTEDGPLS